MSDDNIDFRFLGRQVQILQGDVRDLRAEQLRLEGDVAGLRAELARMQAANETRFDHADEHLTRLETELRTSFKGLDARFDQVGQTMALNLNAILTAIKP